MGLINLEIQSRSETGKNANRRMRAAGRIPAVLYGKGRESELMSLDGHAFGVILTHLGGRTALFNLEQEGRDEEITALLREIQRNPITDQILHVDLMEIPRGVPVTVPVQIQITGECKAVKNGEATVAQTLDFLEIAVRPRDLPDHLEVDISELELNDKIFARDVNLPVGELVTDPDLLVLNIKAQTIFEEETPEGEEGEEGAEGAEGAEGEEAAEGADDDDKKDGE